MALLSSLSSTETPVMPTETAQLEHEKQRELESRAKTTDLSIVIQSIALFILIAGIGALIFYGGYSAFNSDIPGLGSAGFLFMMAGVATGLIGIGVAIDFYRDATKDRELAQHKLREHSVTPLEINKAPV